MFSLYDPKHDVIRDNVVNISVSETNFWRTKFGQIIANNFFQLADSASGKSCSFDRPR